MVLPSIRQSTEALRREVTKYRQWLTDGGNRHVYTRLSPGELPRKLQIPKIFIKPEISESHNTTLKISQKLHTTPTYYFKKIRQ